MHKPERRRVVVRYLLFFTVGIGVEAIRLLAFWVLNRTLDVNMANLLSLPVNIVVSFVLHGGITWNDRGGSSWGKLARFTLNRWALWVLKALVVPLFVILVPCPLYEMTQALVNLVADFVPTLTILHQLFDCNWMSVATTDLILALTIGFLTYDRWAFKDERNGR